MEVTNYVKYGGLKKITLDSLYEGNQYTLAALRENILGVVETEAPLTLGTLKARLREAFGVAKISQRCLDIVNTYIDELGFKKTDNLYDTVLWPSSGIFDIECLRTGGDRLIYDIPYQEMVLLAQDLNFKGEELYRAMLSYFGLQVLTHKAEEYLRFVEEKL